MNLKEKLDNHYLAFDKQKISPDPLQFLHLFDDEKDIEVIGFLASIFAYGSVTQIINTMNRLLNVFNNKPYNFIINLDKKKFPESFSGIKHRFYTERDIASLLLLMNKIYRKHGLLKNLFMQYYIPHEKTLKHSISNFSNNLLKEAAEVTKTDNISAGVRFMFPSPETGSACKRMNLFLRWMVRKDELDFGLWNEIPARKLIIPVDTHIAKICQKLKLTKRKNVNWLMAEEITDNLRKFDPADPVKYDFAICHIGMRKLKFNTN